MNNIILKSTDQHSYLGICLNHNLSWNPHITQLCNKANRLLGFLHRNLKTSPKHIKEMAYKQLILPLLQYCSTIWDPHQQYLIHKLEMVQHRAARFVLKKTMAKKQPGQHHWIITTTKLVNFGNTTEKCQTYSFIQSHQQYINHPCRILTYKILLFHLCIIKHS